MTWQDDLKKRKIEERDLSIEGDARRKREWEIQSKNITVFWDKILKANAALDPEIRLREAEILTSLEQGRLWGANAQSLTLKNYKKYDTNYYKYLYISEITSGISDPYFKIYFDTNRNRLVVEYNKIRWFFSGYKRIRHNIDENAIDILLRNLCIGNRLGEGL